MCKNIVIFGPTHSGKSTLLGYILSQSWSEKQKRSEFSRTQKELGIDYHSDRKFAYIVDTAKDERRDNKQTNQNLKIKKKRKLIGGGSKHIHICNTTINNMDYTFFETPGSDQYWKEKDEGVFLGDIGIYVIELPLLVELSQKVKGSNNYIELERRIFSPLYLWKHYKNVLKLVVVISKIDLNYSRFALETAINIIHSADSFKNVEIVPISIDVENETDCNVYQKCNKIESFYKGMTLFDALAKVINNNMSQKTEEDIVFAHVHKIFHDIKDEKYRPATSLRIKLLSGKVCIGDEIRIGPLKEKNSKNNVFAEGTVGSLRLDLSESVQSLGKGEVGGIIFKEFYVDGKERSLSSFDEKRTTVVFDKEADSENGNLLYLTVDLKNEKSVMKEAFHNLKINDRIKIIWFGKTIATELVGRTYSDSEEGKDIWNLILMNYSASTEESSFLMALNEKREFVFNHFVLQLSNGLYIKSKLTDIDCISRQSPGQVDFTSEYYDNLFEDFSSYLEGNTDINFQFEKNDAVNYLCFTGITNYNIRGLMSILRKFMRHKDIRNYQIDIKKEKSISLD